MFERLYVSMFRLELYPTCGRSTEHRKSLQISHKFMNEWTDEWLLVYLKYTEHTFQNHTFSFRSICSTSVRFVMARNIRLIFRWFVGLLCCKQWYPMSLRWDAMNLLLRNFPPPSHQPNLHVKLDVVRFGEPFCTVHNQRHTEKKQSNN